jgi:hypothetical protein
MKKMMFSAAFCAVMTLSFSFAVSGASAQEYPERTCLPGTPNAHTTCEGRLDPAHPESCVSYSRCVCDDGYVMNGSLSNGDPNCVRPARRSGSGGGSGTTAPRQQICDEELLGTRRAGDRCVCTEANIAAGAIGTVPVFVPATVRRAHGWASHGDARLCVFPMSGQPGPDTEWREYIESWIRQLDMENAIICGSDEGATREERLDDCRATRELIERIPSLMGGGDIMVTVEGQEMPLQDFVTLFVRKVGELIVRVTGLEERMDDLEPRVAALEARSDGGGLQTFLSSMHLRIGAFGMVGGMLPGPATGAGGASLELLFRFGDLPVGAYGRIHFGGQSTGWNVGETMFLSGGAGFTLFTGGREDTTLALGYYGETLVDPYVAGDAFPHDSAGVAHGAEFSASLPIPGVSWLRIRGSIIGAWAERRLIDDQGVYSTPQAFYLAGTLGFEGQVP